MPWRPRHGGVKQFRCPRLQARTKILYKGKPPSKEGGEQGVPWRPRHGAPDWIRTSGLPGRSLSHFFVFVFRTFPCKPEGERCVAQQTVAEYVGHFGA